MFPCGQARPGASTLNYPTGASVANGTIVGLGAGGKICVYTPTRTHVLVDVVGYFPAEVVAVRVAAELGSGRALVNGRTGGDGSCDESGGGIDLGRAGRPTGGDRREICGCGDTPGTGARYGLPGWPMWGPLSGQRGRSDLAGRGSGQRAGCCVHGSRGRWVSASEPLIPGVTALRDEVHLVVGTPEAPGTRAAAQSAAAAGGAVISGGWRDLGVFELRWTTPPTDLQAVWTNSMPSPVYKPPDLRCPTLARPR